MDTPGGNVCVSYFPSASLGNQLTRYWQLLQLIDQPAGIAVEDAARTIWRAADTLEVRRWILGYGPTQRS